MMEAKERSQEVKSRKKDQKVCTPFLLQALTKPVTVKDIRMINTCL